MIRKTIKDICDNLGKFIVRYEDYGDGRGVFVWLIYESVTIHIDPAEGQKPRFIEFSIEKYAKKPFLHEKIALWQGIIRSDKINDDVITQLTREERELIFKSVNNFLSEYVGAPTGDSLPIINFN
jgi:hypothetical protein